MESSDSQKPAAAAPQAPPAGASAPSAPPDLPPKRRPRALTGIQGTGAAHLGNWLGAIRPALALARDFDTFYFIADYHSLNSVQDPQALRENSLSIAATYLAFGLDPKASVFYRQSEIPEVFELSWILSCFCAKGLLNRAHSYKDAVAKNIEGGRDPDHNINMGKYLYPVLMAADILLFRADTVPVGQDQKQHVEYAQDLAERFNHHYGVPAFAVPAPRFAEGVQVVAGLDGRKMSKSYDNTIPLFVEPKALQKLVNRIVSNSQAPEEPKDPDSSAIFSLHRLLLAPGAEEDLRRRYRAGGMGWGQAKKELFEALDAALSGPRKLYQEILADREGLLRILAEGRDRARAEAVPFLQSLRRIIGIR